MKVRSRIAYLSAAVTVVLYGGAATLARDLTWDANNTTAPLGQDGPGAWDLATQNWVDGDLVTGTNATWSNSPADSAIFGNATSAPINTVTPNDIELASPISVQNITFGTGTDGSTYNISDFSGGSLTLNGNMTKTSTGGQVNLLLNNGIALGAGDHTIALIDTPGDVAEMAINGPVTGAGNLVVDNGATYAQWGTLALNVDNSYTGTTTINKGRLVITTSNGLGATSAGTVIGPQGEFSIGGGGTTVTSGLNIAEPITITRNTYTGTDFSDYPEAVVAANGSGTHTFSGPFVVDSTDARVAAQTSTIVIASSLTAGSDVTAGSAVLDLDGDFAGFITLSADNTAYGSAGNAIALRGGVELNVSSEANLGGANSTLIFGGGTIHPTGALASSAFMTNFGTHNISTVPINTGVDIDAGNTFTVNSLSGAAIGERGLGTMNFQGTNTFTGTPFFDGGTINFVAGSSTTQMGLRLRSPVVNIAGSLDVSGSYTSIGVDSTGTNGGPDMATINLTGNGQLIENSGDDFNISDNANTSGTINIHDNAALTTGGITWLGKSNGAVGTINQDGGTLTINRSGNFGFVIADGRNGHTPTGYYNLGGTGVFTSAGEVYVGEGSDTGGRGTGFWTQTGGTANVNNWFVVGREGAAGTVDISGGTLNHSGGNMSLGDSNGGGATDTINVHGTAVINDTAGEMWVGNNGGAIAVMNVADSASITVNTWLAIGRNGGNGTVNLSGGTITQQTANHLDIGAGGTGTVNVTGGTLTGLNTFLGEVGSGSGTLNISSAGNVVLNGTTIFANANSVTGNLNLNGGTLTAFGFQANNGGGTGQGTFTFNGGNLLAGADATNFIGAKVTSVVSTGGALINSNGHAVTVNSVLTHDSSLAGADGGLSKSGDGTLTVAGASTYTGPTSAGAGSLVFNQSLTTSSSVSASGTGAVALASGAGNNLVIMTPSVSTADTGKIDLTDNKLIVTTAGQTGTWDAGSSQYTGIAGMVQSARGDGTWNGATGITTSSAASNLNSLAVAKVGDFKGITDTDTATFGGQSVHGSDTVVMYTYGGDANLDGKINIDDYGRIDGNVGLSGTVFGWYSGDFNYDGKINIDDYGIIDGNIGIQGAPIPNAAAQTLAGFADAGVSAVPEPATVSLVGMIGAGLLQRRRRRRG